VLLNTTPGCLTTSAGSVGALTQPAKTINNNASDLKEFLIYLSKKSVKQSGIPNEWLLLSIHKNNEIMLIHHTGGAEMIGSPCLFQINQPFASRFL
jgi:hypothetical protein